MALPQTTMSRYWRDVEKPQTDIQGRWGGSIDEQTQDYSTKSYRDLFPGLYQRWDEQQGAIGGFDKLLSGNRSIVADLSSQLAELAEMRNLMTEPSDWITKWLLDKQTSELERRLDRTTDASNWMVMQQEAMETAGWAGPSGEGRTDWVMAHLPPEFGKEAERVTTPTEYPIASPSVSPPIPDWMRQYFEESMAGTQKSPEGKGRRGEAPWQERQAFAVRPLGAQSEASPDELAMLQGYMGWTKAGAPTEFSQKYASSLENLPSWWSNYVKESEALFPSKAKLPVRWRTSRQ